MQFKGRELATLQEIAVNMLREVHTHVEDVGAWEVEPRLAGRNMQAILAPLK